MGKTKQILKGKFPEEQLTLDEQVAIVNKAGDKLFILFSTGAPEDKIDAKVNNLALWLGGLHPDIQVYAFQLLLNYHQIEFNADDKTEARMARLEDRIGIGTKPGLKEYSYDRINHYPWPVEFLDGTTFEDRLEALVEEQGIEKAPVDLLLTGMPLPEMDTIQRFQLAQEAVEEIAALYEKYGEANVLYLERFNRVFNWLLDNEDEIALYSFRWLMAGKEIMFDPVKVERWDEYVARYKDIMLSHTFPSNPN